MIRCISIILGILSWAMSRRLSQLTCLWMSLQEASRQLGNLTGLLKLSVLGLSFVFYVKAERTQQGNLLVDDLLVLLDGYCSNSSKIVCIWQLPFPLVLPGGHQKRVLIEIKNVLMIKLTARLDNNLSAW